ncbi:MAG: hypothetical protein HYT62_04140 [Candidatus Yanofskybacteria bacterium]|nr:hypothetical protein [Candidatus Yanofskybacteria bacterium]
MTNWLPWLLFGLATYLLIGMMLTHYAPLGKRYFARTRTRLIFLWIFPVAGIVLYVIVMLFCVLVVDLILFNGGNTPDGGLEKLFDNM